MGSDILVRSLFIVNVSRKRQDKKYSRNYTGCAKNVSNGVILSVQKLKHSNWTIILFWYLCRDDLHSTKKQRKEISKPNLTMSNYLKLSNYVWSSTIRKDSISIATSTCTFYVLGNYCTTILTLFYTMGLNLSCSNFYFLFFFFLLLYI